jgi:hypothetical protein
MNIFEPQKNPGSAQPQNFFKRSKAADYKSTKNLTG